MQRTTNYSADIVGVKRQLPASLDLGQFGDLCKKVRMERMEEPEPYIPPLLLPSPKPTSPNNPNNVNTEYLKSLLLLNQSVMTQRYLQLLTLNQCVQQQQHQQLQQLQVQKQQQEEYHRTLLALKREDSVSSCNSVSTCNTSSPVKVPILIRRTPSDQSVLVENIPRLDDCTPQKKSKVSACKNYIALLCTGFARSILTASAESDILSYLHEIMNIKKAKYSSLMERQAQELQDYILEHLYKDICGKRVKKMNKGRDFKVRNSEELELLLAHKEEDTEIVKFRKEVIKEMIDYFFVSKYYYEWLEKGMINPANRDFFMKNKTEIQKKFSNPTLYKPHFDYNTN